MHRFLTLVLFALFTAQPALAQAPAETADPTAEPVSHAGHAGPVSDHAHDAPALPAPDPAHRWLADATLVGGMQRLRDASAKLAALESRPPAAGTTKEAVAGIGADIQQTVDTLFVECRLAPEPDAALHALLARVLTARHGLASEHPDPAAARAVLDEVLARYAERFVEPD